jgi:hypothetical protein
MQFTETVQAVSAEQLPLVYQPDVIFPQRLEWLCQPEQIEYTLRLLCNLQSWKRAHLHILYADRQGLQEVQTLILAHATRAGVLQPVTYLDGTERFPGELLLESAANNAATGVLTSIRGLCDPQIWPPFYPDGTARYQHFIRPLYKRIIGKDCKIVGDALNTVTFEQIRDYIQERLQRLVARAKATRKPIQLQNLAALCIAPMDLLHIRDNRINFLDSYDCWEELDRYDLRKLDPEGSSEIALQYFSPTAQYIFHVPFREAVKFISAERLSELQAMPGSSQEIGRVQDQTLTEMENLERPAREILQDLGVNIASVCPYELQDKQFFLSKPAIRELLWPTRYYENEDWSDDPWDGICLPQRLVR